MAMIACFITGEMSDASTTTRRSLPVSRPSCLPWRSTILVFCDAGSSSRGRPLATAIIIPNTVESAAMMPSPNSTSSTRHFLTFTRRRPGGSSWPGRSGIGGGGPCPWPFVAISGRLVASRPLGVSVSRSGSFISVIEPACRAHRRLPENRAVAPSSGSRECADSGRARRESLALARMSAVGSDAAATAAHLARNAVDCLPAGALEERLATGSPLRVKLGLDPTAPDLHLGHTVVLQKLREFQDAGHTVVLIVGNYTARVGDPSGRSATRPVLSPEEIDAHARTYVAQAGKVLATDKRLELRHNSEWLDMPVEDLFRLVRTVTVAQLLARDDFAKRWAATEPISLLELLYPVMQGYDSVAIKADVELGGTDQKFNLLMGRELQTTYDQRPQVVLTTPLLTGIDGERKMSKSYGNQIGITEPPEEMYGKTLSIPDALLDEWYGLLLGTSPPADLGPRDAKHALARALVARFHGEEEAAAAAARFERVFVARELPEEIEEAVVHPSNGLVHLPGLIASVFGGSRSEARRAIEAGGVRLDGEPVSDLDLPAPALDGRVLQVGKRRFRRLRVA